MYTTNYEENKKRWAYIRDKLSSPSYVYFKYLGNIRGSRHLFVAMKVYLYRGEVVHKKEYNLVKHWYRSLEEYGCRKRVFGMKIKMYTCFEAFKDLVTDLPLKHSEYCKLRCSTT